MSCLYNPNSLGNTITINIVRVEYNNPAKNTMRISFVELVKV